MKKLVVAGVFSLLSVQAFAQESAENRSGKQFDIGVQPIGFAVFPVISQGISGGYYINPDFIIEAEFTTGSFGDISGSSSVENNGIKSEDTYSYKISAKTYGVKVKNFWGNSFYSNAGLAMRKIAVDGKSTFVVAGEELYRDKKVSFGASSLSLDFAIGNKWQFENFNIGCDWFGVNIPISSSTEDNLKDEISTNSNSYNQFKDSLEKLGETTSYQITKFYIGMSF